MTRLPCLRLLVFTLTLIATRAHPIPTTFTPNDVRDDRSGAVALVNATIHVDPDTRVDGGTLLMRDGEIEATGSNITVPDGYAVHDLAGKTVYPGFIDLFSDYGLPEPAKATRSSFSVPEIMTPQTPGAYNANDAIRSHYSAAIEFAPDEKRASELRKLGFTTVLTFRRDGIARGTAALVDLDDGNVNEIMLDAEAATHFSLYKGSSKQSFPLSLMGAVALIRQTHFDAAWYAAGARGFTDQSLAAWTSTGMLPKIFEVLNWRQLMTVHRVAAELGVDYIIKSAGDDYQRIDAIRTTGRALIVPLAFPSPPDVSDPFDARRTSLREMKHWELAPTNPGRVAEAGIRFAITAFGAGKDFRKNLVEAVDHGLARDKALAALTTSPAALIDRTDLGHLKRGARANLIVTSGDFFENGTVIHETWIRGRRYEANTQDSRHNGSYELRLAETAVTLKLSGLPGKAKVEVVAPDGSARAEDTDAKKWKASVALDRDQITLSITPPDSEGALRLGGWFTDDGMEGRGQRPDGEWLNWTARRVQGDEGTETTDAASKDEETTAGDVIYPFVAHGQTSLPRQEDMLIRNATVWTLTGDDEPATLDVLVRDGRIARVAQSIESGSARVIDGTGKHLTPGIVDEHAHLALDGINDIATNSSMVRMMDVVNSEDINLYRNLAGGVTTAQLLHGSANPVGGQSAIIKFRWGSLPQDLLIDGADKFIKFALGENVKRSSNTRSVRYPQTRMGVEQVFDNWFSAAREYESDWRAWNALSRSQKRRNPPPRRDLVLETMVEVLSGERFVTSHSYVQSEINMLMKVAERYGFRINTFTHILEGYKVADSMRRHGAGGSTFADNWAYKWEVRYAIPYNSALMHRAGVTVAVNSDSAERARRLNHEAAKAIKYGGLRETEALKLITLNPAKLLHLDDRIGSIREGKDADLVLWDGHPLSVYSTVDTTIIDGTVYYDCETDRQTREWISAERHRLITRLQAAKSRGAATKSGGTPPPPSYQCDSLHGFEAVLEGQGGAER